MPRTAAIGSYRHLAQFYDEFFSSLRYPIDAARERTLRGILPRVETACDLACGTGVTALRLASSGISMYAVDLSPQMCRFVRAKARRARLPVRVIRADMRSFKLSEPVDLITCEFDALNHIPRRADLTRVAKSVQRALRPGGHFLFDVNNSLGFERYWTGTVWLEKRGVVMVMRNGHNRQASQAWCDIDLFIREGSCWKRRHERVEEVCWDSDEIHRVFKQAGFDQIRAWDAAPFFKDISNLKQRDGSIPLLTPGCRTFYLVCKSRD